jgi:hypothetical protein
MASHYIYNGLGRALEKLGHEWQFWYPQQNSAFDIFNSYMPDVFLGQGYNLDRPTIKCINNNPDIKCLMKVGIWGDIDEEFDHNEYEALFTSDQEKLNIDALQNKNRIFLFNYGTDRYHDLLIKKWADVANTFMFTLAADNEVFYPEYNEKIKSDLCFIGGYWPYKGKNINKYIIPLCYPVGKYNIKIFGNQVWPVSQYMGFASDDLTRQLISSTSISIAVHEPHANTYEYEQESRIFNAVACKALVISDYVESYKLDIFKNDEIIMCKTPEEYLEQIEFYLNNPEERKKKIDEAYDTLSSN